MNMVDTMDDMHQVGKELKERGTKLGRWIGIHAEERSAVMRMIRAGVYVGVIRLAFPYMSQEDFLSYAKEAKESV